MNPSHDLAAWRRQIPLLASAIPMNNCSQAPQTDATRAAAGRYLDSWNSQGMDWDAWMAEVQLAKQAFANLINADADQIAIFSSVSEAASAVASALDFDGDRRTVVATEAEFPTIGHVWLAQQRRGARLDWVPLREGRILLDDYDAVLTPDTALVSACHGYYLNGMTQDLRALAERAHANGSLLFVDAYQTAGVVPIDVGALGVDFLASGTLKYLMGIPGIAFLYVKPELIERLEPMVTGWFGRANPFAFDVKRLDWSATASRFDTGTPPIINAYISRAGMEMISSVGVQAIRAWHEVLARRLLEGGRARGLTVHGVADVADKTANTAFVVADAHGIEHAMRERGVIASARGPVIRLAPHFYSSLEDADTALDVLAEVLGN
ncbi:MAG: aminotransferase class V-fold PLP-dependent enzyme [Gemmatimonadales bacterium]|nr:aminotransferase class V-fold PLP-dependent enzyme [Gemmatimonadales bacterium]MDZ4388879.1 aminotransferase class V-fold PLP-dependent enzyme [Gemmatimonadales bacterium]